MSRPRIAVVGGGWWASTAHLPSLASYDGAELVAVCDPRRERMATASERFGVPGYSDIGAMLAGTQIDGAIVATPHTTHHRLARQLLDAGVHVFVEKPLTTTASDAWDLVRVADDAGLHLVVGYTYQHASTAAFARDAVREQIGELVCVTAEFASSTAHLFAGGADPTASDEPHPTTYADPALSGGGQGQTQVTHLMGMVLWVVGRQVSEVFCYMDPRGTQVDVVDVMSFRFDGGGLGTVTSPGTTVDGLPARTHIRYYGTEGVVDQDLATARIVLHRRNGEQVVREADEVSYPARIPARAFADLIAGCGPNHASGEPAAATVAFLDAAYESAKTGLAQRPTAE